MIDTTATRRVTFNGKTYQKGDTVQMPAAQFNELGPDGVGLFERPAPAKTKSKSDDSAD